MASPVINALDQAFYTGSSPKGHFWAFRHPNPDAPPQTYRLTKRSGNGWILLISASKETKQVLGFYADAPEDQQVVQEALKWFGINAQLETREDGVYMKTGGREIPSKLYGGEKPKK